MIKNVGILLLSIVSLHACTQISNSVSSNTSQDLIDREVQHLLMTETLASEDQISLDAILPAHILVEENNLKLIVVIDDMNDFPESIKAKLIESIKSGIATSKLDAKLQDEPFVELQYFHNTFKTDKIIGMVFERWAKINGPDYDDGFADSGPVIWVIDQTKVPRSLYYDGSAEIDTWFQREALTEAKQDISAYIRPKLTECLKRDQNRKSEDFLQALKYMELWAAPDRIPLSKMSISPSTKDGLIGGLRFHMGTAMGEPNAGFYIIDIPQNIFSQHLMSEWAAYFGGEPVQYQSNSLQRICK